MMSPPRWLSILLMALPIAGCGGVQNHYRASGENRPEGFAESYVRPDAMEVSFVAEGNLSAADAHYYAAIRAAELALQAGKPAFQIVLEHASRGRELVYVPPTYENQATTDANGNVTYTQVEVSPGYTETDYYPIATLLVRFLDAPQAGSLDAAGVAREAQAKGIKLSPQTLVHLGTGT